MRSTSARTRPRARRSRSRRCRRARWSRSRPSRSHSVRGRRAVARMQRMLRAIEEYVRSLEPDAYLVGGAVRDELLGHDSKDADFLVPGVDIEGLREALPPHRTPPGPSARG